jgi:hypothetical protein
MKYFPVISLLAALSWMTSDAWAQYGLYGSPALVELPSVQAQAYVPQNTLAEPTPPYRVAPAPHVAGVWDARPMPAASNPFPQMLDPAYPAYPPLGPAMHTVSAKRPPKKKQPPEPGRDPEKTLSVVEEMLGESGGGFPPPWGPEPGCDVGADCGDSCLPCFQPKWYVSVQGLIMTRGDKPNKVWTTYEATDSSNQLMDTVYSMEWEGGFDLRIGRRFCCGAWALEAGYWTLNPFETSVYRSHPNLVSTPLDFLNVEDPVTAGEAGFLFDDAEAHVVWRRNEVHSVELNLIHNPLDPMCAGSFSCSWAFGPRFFRFEEDLVFASLDEGGTAFGQDPTGYLDDKVVNNLVGVQLGCRVDYSRDKWRLFVFPKAGIYNNHIRHRFSAYRRDAVNGEVLFNVLWPGYPQYPVNSTKDVVSFLTEFDVGLEWQFHPKWSATIGYRATLATGVGLADHQIPFYPGDTPEIADIDYNGYLLLHGGFAGVTFQF